MEEWSRYMGMKVIGFSIITDLGFPDALEPVNVETIIETAKGAEPTLTRLVEKIVEEMNV